MALCIPPASADQYPRQPGIDVERYGFRLELRDGTKEIRGEADIHVLFKADAVAEVALDLIGSKPGAAGGMVVSSVADETGKLGFVHEGDRLRVKLGVPGTQGGRRRLTVSYAGVPSDGLLIGPNRHGELVFFGDNFPNRARHWLPVLDHPSDKAAVEFEITAPEPYQVVAPGLLVESTNLPENRRLTRYRETVPITTYCMVIGVGRFAVETIGHVGAVPVQSWVYPQERAAGFSDFRIALRPMELFSWRVGPFPYEKLANVQSKTRYGGMENASAIFYREGVVSGKGTNEGLFAHEIAHQWFGDSVTESDWDHTWLSEGFATYFTHVYHEYTAGRDAMARGLRRDRENVVRYFAKNPSSAIVTPASAALDNILSTNSYQKGGWFLHMLRRLVGDEAFWRGVSTLLCPVPRRQRRDRRLPARDGGGVGPSARHVLPAVGPDARTADARRDLVLDLRRADGRDHPGAGGRHDLRHVPRPRVPSRARPGAPGGNRPPPPAPAVLLLRPRQGTVRGRARPQRLVADAGRRVHAKAAVTADRSVRDASKNGSRRFSPRRRPRLGGPGAHAFRFGARPGAGDRHPRPPELRAGVSLDRVEGQQQADLHACR